MRNIIKSMIKVARMLTCDDSGIYRRGTFFYQGQNDSKALIFTPYGFCHNPPPDSMAIMFSQNGQDSNSVAIIDDPANRFKGLASGEVAVGNYVTGSKVHFKANGDIDITANGDVNLNVTGAVNITIGSMIAIIDSSGITVTSGDIVADGISLKGHVHGGVVSGGSNTGVPV